MTTPRILVVDDEPGMARLIGLYLRQAGYSVVIEETGAGAVQAVEAGSIDLVVLDIGLPDLDGYSVCRHLRRAGSVPVVMVTARSDHRDRITGFDLGADDYLTKPFNPEELVVRVRAVLRRAHPEESLPNHIAVDGLEVDLLQRRVTVHGRAIDLRPKEFELLVALATHPGRVFTREQLLRRVWGYEAMGNSGTVDVHIMRLRQKLSEPGQKDRWIGTVWGAGYRFHARSHGA